MCKVNWLIHQLKKYPPDADVIINFEANGMEMQIYLSEVDRLEVSELKTNPERKRKIVFINAEGYNSSEEY